VLQLARRVFLVVHARALEQPLDGRQLVGRVQDLEGLGQPGIPVVRAQHPVAQAVEGAYPHAAGIDGQQRADACQHLARGLVGEGNGHQPVRADLAGLDQPGHARGQHPRLAAAGAGQHQGVAGFDRDGGVLGGVEVVEQGHGAEGWNERVRQAV